LWCLPPREATGAAQRFCHYVRVSRRKALQGHGTARPARAGQRCSNPVMHGLAVCAAHGGKGAKFGITAWQRMRTETGTKLAPVAKKPETVRVEQHEQRQAEEREAVMVREQQSNLPPRPSLEAAFRSHHRGAVRPLRPLYEA
jgi:hypothetical protein